jgi:hypothetical protein
MTIEEIKGSQGKELLDFTMQDAREKGRKVRNTGLRPEFQSRLAKVGGQEHNKLFNCEALTLLAILWHMT